MFERLIDDGLYFVDHGDCFVGFKLSAELSKANNITAGKIVLDKMQT